MSGMNLTMFLCVSLIANAIFICILLIKLIGKWGELVQKKIDNEMKLYEMIYRLDLERIKSNR